MNKIAMQDYRELAVHLRDTLKPNEYNQNDCNRCFLGHICKLVDEWINEQKDLDITRIEYWYIFGTENDINICAKDLHFLPSESFTVHDLVKRIDDIIQLNGGLNE